MRESGGDIGSDKEDILELEKGMKKKWEGPRDSWVQLKNHVRLLFFSTLSSSSLYFLLLPHLVIKISAGFPIIPFFYLFFSLPVSPCGRPSSGTEERASEVWGQASFGKCKLDCQGG